VGKVNKEKAIKTLDTMESPVAIGSTDNKVNPVQKESLLRLEKKLERYQPVKFQKESSDQSSRRYSIQDEEMPETSVKMFETTGVHDLSTGSYLLSQAFQAQPQLDPRWYHVTRLMHEIAPQDGLEGMLATQMIAVHNMAMDCSRRAMVKDQNPNAVERNINRASKLMNVFTRQIEALQRYRTKGQQKITVQHVQVADGGQAIIGDVNPLRGHSC
jgi:hypothetical protein